MPAGSDLSKVTCFNCNKLGHFASSCTEPRNFQRRPRATVAGAHVEGWDEEVYEDWEHSVHQAACAASDLFQADVLYRLSEQADDADEPPSDTLVGPSLDSDPDAIDPVPSAALHVENEGEDETGSVFAYDDYALGTGFDQAAVAAAGVSMDPSRTLNRVQGLKPQTEGTLIEYDKS